MQWYSSQNTYASMHFFNHQAADLQPKPDGKITQTVNMVQLLTVKTNHLQINKFVVLPKKR